MATENPYNVTEEREEGEIIEDELEDVSDCSIYSPPSLGGKSQQSTDRLRAVSLSSISATDNDNDDVVDSQIVPPAPPAKIVRKLRTPRKSKSSLSHTSITNNKNRRRRRRRSACSCCKRHHGKRIAPPSSESEDEKTLDKRTLRQLHEAVRVSNGVKEVQKNSLRARLRGLINGEGEEHTKETEEKEKVEESCEKVEDSLNDKELTELRLEALKSAMLKKHMARKKRKLRSDGEEVDKENSKSDMNVEQAKKSDEAAVVPENGNVTAEEDLDIMRAMLLASVSTKISKITDNLPKAPQTNPQCKPQVVNKNIYKLQKSAPKHVIHNTYFNNNKHTVNNKTQPKIPTVAPLIIKINSDTDSDMDLESPQEEDDKITKFLKGERAKVEAEVERKQTPPRKEIFDKSVVKLLPPSRQVEYQKLKQQLLNAKKRPRIRKLSNKIDIKKEVPIVRKQIKPKTAVNRLNTPNKEASKFKNNPVRKTMGENLQKTIQDLQIQKDGRLQGKYQELAPIVKRVEMAGLERKRYEIEIKRLLLELEKTKKKFSSSHQNFKSLIEELMRRKAAIDKATETNKKSLATSTPLKAATDVASPLERLNESAIAKQELKIEQILDPNDITEGLMKQQALLQTNVVPKYESPLDRRTGGCEEALDPLATYCPYELLGVCKDKECNYKHCSSYLEGTGVQKAQIS